MYSSRIHIESSLCVLQSRPQASRRLVRAFSLRRITIHFFQPEDHPVDEMCVSTLAKPLTVLCTETGGLVLNSV